MYVANKICDDELNHEGCMFDGGDCCLTGYESKIDCDKCECSPYGTITSPGYPDRYSHNLDLNWLIQVPKGQLVEVSFKYFHVGYGDDSW